MKKTLLLMAAAAMTFAASAQTKAVDDLRIYINPGHGGWSSGDRALGTVKHGEPVFDSAKQEYNDTTGFFETNTNTWKGLALLQRLSEYGFKYDPTLNQKPDGAEDVLYRWGAARDMSQGLVMSHVKNGVSRDINEIAREVEANNFDFFISVHSNAHEDGRATNYPAMFIRGENGTESSPGSYNASKTIWPFAYSNQHANWSNYSMTNPSINYDIDFWGGDYAVTDHGNGNVVKGYYAVLRHNVPGLLCEGYFHTYQPARHRAMNPDVCKIEGEAYARGIATYFGVATEKTGDLYGIVRDKHEKFHHKYYNAPAASDDAYMPLNNVKVTLKDKDGNAVRSYITDDEYNGVFVFRQLEPGTYSVTIEADGYKEADMAECGPFEVKAAEVTYCNMSLESESYIPPAVTYFDYPDELNGLPTVNAATRYNFTAATVDKDIPALADKAVKRMIVKGDNIYILAHDAAKAPTLLVADANTLEVKAEVSTAGTEGSECDLADIAVTADGILIGTADELNHINDEQVEAGETRGDMNVYRWANDENGLPAGDPVKWFSTQVTANFYKAYTGFTFAYSGTSTEGQMYLPSASFWYNKKVWLNILDIVDGTLASTSFVNDTRDLMNMDDLGDDVTISISPNNSKSFIVNSSKVAPMQFNSKGYVLEATMAEGMPAREGYFKYAGHSMMAVSDVAEDGAHTGVRLVDITDGIASHRQIETTNTAIEAAAAASASAGRTVVIRDAGDNVTGGNIDLYTLRGNKISRFTTAKTEQPTFRGNWAYDLRQEINGDKAVLSFALTEAADATVTLVPAADADADAKSVTVASKAFEKGVNTVDVDLTTLSGKYNWQVSVANDPVPAVAKVFEGEYGVSGAVMDMNPEHDNFGRIYLSRYSQYNSDRRGITMMDPQLNELVDFNAPYTAGAWEMSVGASPWRQAILPSGKLLVSDWSDPHGGIYLFDPETKQLSNFFAGTINPANGEWTFDGHVIGGSTSGIAVGGTGDNTVLYSFQEDWPSDYSLNLVKYNLGTKEQIDFRPEQPAGYAKASQYLINGNVEVVYNPNGLVLGQVRGSGNNSSNVPSFLVTDLEGNILYNSGESWESLKGSDGAITLNRDGSLLALQSPGGVINIARVEWQPEFKLTPLYNFTAAINGSASYQAFFDPADNFCLASRYGFFVYALPREANTATTSARSSFVLTGASEGVDNIATDESESNAPAVYYNMQGIRVSADSLTPGVYVRRQGNSSAKVIIR